ncbi:hypothetical protein ANN_15339 [Periplaneta americana]|uniref:Transglutaminase-like domain-containing protein n=1 Tax=Periplaneta americana TaxID=6978 RepID=A0ABQ8SH76_PERAM|nr:hypothetical protein ANN_15339 [Periplaneta americana]
MAGLCEGGNELAGSLKAISGYCQKISKELVRVIKKAIIRVKVGEAVIAIMSNDEKLVVKSVHLYPLENGKLHHTDKFEMLHQETPRAILRRAQPFHLVVNFSGRGYDPEKDSVQLIFSYGLRPNVIKGTKGVSTVTEKKTEDENAWYARLVGKDESSMNVEVRSPPDTPVGLWKFQIETRPKDDPSAKPKSFTYDDKIYILFNPWAKTMKGEVLNISAGDQVYMSDERLLDEYVLSDVGKIWVGPYNSSRGREWVYGQFDDAVLPAIDLMLSRTNVAPVNRGNPIYVTRAISKIVNSNDSDMGVLTGRWDGKYEDGTPPAAWTGSVPILEEYLETQNEVKYGQCWVFAGVVTTVCRALGIPCRPVSNLVSAHDANASLTIDRYYDTEMELLDFDPTNPEGEDSIWNYHVWNDVWMARPDLPKGYGGWQAIDATPQETSDAAQLERNEFLNILSYFFVFAQCRSDAFNGQGSIPGLVVMEFLVDKANVIKRVYQCGPASVEAVKCGVIGFNYDVSFLLSTVNADLVRWKEDTTDPNNYAKIDSNKYQTIEAGYEQYY